MDDPENPLSGFRSFAEQGDKDAQYLLDEVEDLVGSEPKYQETERLYRDAADRGAVSEQIGLSGAGSVCSVVG